MPKRELIIIAGPNGAGKTTFAKSFLKDYKYEFLNADEISKQLSENGKRAGNIAAGKEYFKRLNTLFKKRKNILLESTLSGLFLKKLIHEFKQKKYFITLVYVYLADPEMCIERIKVRVSKGGHHVPDEDVIRRFHRGRFNFWKIYRYLSDQWLLINNSEFSFEHVAINDRKNYKVINYHLFNLFEKSISNEKS